MAGRRNRINIDGEQVTQANLFAPLAEKKRFNPFPKLSYTVEDFRRVLHESDGPLGHDYEYPESYKATVIGISTMEEAASVRCTPELVREVVDDVKRKKRTLVGHSVLGAERRVIEVMTGARLGLEYFDDSMLSFHLLNADLCGSPQKTEDAEERGSLGFMGLNTTAHMHTLLPAWKNCRGIDCEEDVCPRHNVFGYNAVDSYASLAAHHEMMEEMNTYGVQQWYYREKLELSEIALLMEENGIKIDRDYVKRFDAESEERKAALFPYTMKGKERVYTVINPRSPQQVLEYFKANGVSLPAVDKKAVRKALEGLAEKHGYDLKTLESVDIESLPTVLKHLYHLDLFKTQGKGLDPWFADKYLDKDGFVHPRFVVTGTATDRWSSSRPNLTNVPSHGAWGSLVKQAIIPREPGLEIADVDACCVPGTKILTSDLRWVNCEDVVEGDKLVGFDDCYGPQRGVGKGHVGSRFRQAVVERTSSLKLRTYRIVTTKGEITVSAPHQFVCRRTMTSGGGAVRQWVQAQDLKVGDILAYTIEPWEVDRSYESGWLAGFFDGEGWICSDTRIVGFGQKGDSVALETALALLEEKEVKTTGGNHRAFTKVYKADGTTYNPSVPVLKYTVCNMWQSARFLGSVRPSRLMPKASFIWEGRRTWGKHTLSAEVLSVEYVGVQKVIAIKTSTDTYVSNGFLSHNSQLEFRNILFQGGREAKDMPPKIFEYLVEKSGGGFKQTADFLQQEERQVAKTVVYGSLYGEGMSILDPHDLERSNIKREIEYGARKVYLKKYGAAFDWTFKDQVITFTGGNMAERLFRDKTYESRRKALYLCEDVLMSAFNIRKWQKDVSDEVEAKGYVQCPYTGKILRVYGSAEDMIKPALSFRGQGCSAVHIQGITLRFKREMNLVPLITVHDSAVIEFPKHWSDKRLREHLQFMFEPNHRLPGFFTPAGIKRGPNYGTLRKLEL